jgi:CheY-like chemotaxis protein
MPEMDGYQATALIRESERATGTEGGPMRIVALTAHAMEGDRERCLAAGMDDYLAKPFSQDQLGKVLGRWLKPAPAPAKRSTSAETGRQGVQASSGDGAEKGSIDREALDTIRALQRQGKPDLLARVINIYLEDSLKLLEALRQACPRGTGLASSARPTV